MKQVEEIFKPSTKDLLSIFSENGVIFQIPSYQRGYAWEKKDLERLIKDIEDGYKRFDVNTDYQTLCFLGSIITVNISDKIDTVSSPLNVVDGQQRLTSTLLLIQTLHLYIKELFTSNNFMTENIKEWIKDEIQEIEQHTLDCLFSLKKRKNEYYEYLPKIVREGFDTLSFRENKYNYSSPIADYLHQYAKYICKKENKDCLFHTDFKWIIEDNDKYSESVNSAISILKESIKKNKFLTEDEEKDDILPLLTQENRFYSLKDFNKEVITQDLNDILNKDDGSREISKILRLISFSKFIFNNVIVTEVRTYEKYQFDAFESLNTTGVPLTAIDIFRAKALSSYNNNSVKSVICKDDIKILDEIDEHIQSIPQKSRAKESRELVSSFLLYMDGIKPEEHLSWQRNKLVELYEKAESTQRVDVLIKSLKDIVDFRSNFWHEKKLTKQLEELETSDEILVYLDYFRQLNSTLVIPILTRIYTLNYKTDSEKFIRMVKSLTYFTMLWRLSHPNTSSIDSVFRGLMAGSNSRVPFSVGLEKQNAYVSESDFNDYLSNEIEKKKINTFELWINKFKVNQIYNVSKPTARLALLTCYHKSKLAQDKVSITKVDTKVTELNNLVNIRSWRSQKYKTLEHVAPQNIKDSKDWDPKIYQDGEILPNCLGNLTILPEAENSAIGNNCWNIKKVYLECFTAADNIEVQKNLDELKSNGIAVKKNTIDIMNSNHALGLPVTSILEIEEWNKKVIVDRQQNFAELIWKEACNYLVINPLTLTN
ncbi:DUF262 domain-containing protein [Enterovibrio norvegicus]|uniref:DUF262 domain-containing protein n=1 Tax=Enterovibrio norvegicus TaxID=188144 RepID=A0ABV4L4W5_9GAMM